MENENVKDNKNEEICIQNLTKQDLIDIIVEANQRKKRVNTQNNRIITFCKALYKIIFSNKDEINKSFKDNNCLLHLLIDMCFNISMGFLVFMNIINIVSIFKLFTLSLNGISNCCLIVCAIIINVCIFCVLKVSKCKYSDIEDADTLHKCLQTYIGFLALIVAIVTFAVANFNNSNDQTIQILNEILENIKALK